MIPGSTTLVRVIKRIAGLREKQPVSVRLDPANGKCGRCGVCGSSDFADLAVLSDNLIAEWELSPEEAAYMDIQQGRKCTTCGANLRSMVLANAIRLHINTKTFLRDIAPEGLPHDFQVLELNEAGTLSPILRRFPGYTFGAYPKVDMHAMPYDSGKFDLVVHSDTLEHIENPVSALTECRRVLKPQGALCFTVPIIVGRMSRNRAGLPNSYHGGQFLTRSDFLVHTEFGADTWTLLMQAGFERVEFVSLFYPAGVAIVARRFGEA